MEQRKLGANGPAVSALGLGLMGMSDLYGDADRSAAIATIHRALDSGLNLLDTGDFYGMGHNEMLLAEALNARKREDVFIGVKFGALRGPDGAFAGVDNRPAALKNFLAYSLKRLKTEYVDLYQPARLDPAVPIEDTVGALADLVKAGYIRHIGMSEIGADTLRRAHAVHPIAALQIEYSLLSRGIEKEILPATQELGIAVTAYGVLARGLLTGSKPQGPNDFRAHMPRFRGENLRKNTELAEALEQVATKLQATPAQVAIAWVYSRGENIIPLVGARTPERLADAMGALSLKLGAAELAAIEKAVPKDAAAGGRYDEEHQSALDSER